jgi:hypothetical protein
VLPDLTDLRDFCKTFPVKRSESGVGQEGILSDVFLPPLSDRKQSHGQQPREKGTTNYELIQINNDNFNRKE